MDKAFVNVYAPSNRASKQCESKPNRLKEGIDNII